MTARELTTVVDRMSFTECPRWHDGRLYFSDFYSQRVMSVRPGEPAEEVARVAYQPSGLGWLPDGRMLVVSMLDRRVLRREHSGELVEHADLSAIATGNLNDMVVAPSGVAYVGNFGFDLMAGAPVAPSPLVRIDPDGTIDVATEPLSFANGAVITPDGGTLIVAETFGNRISAFAVAEDGTLGPRRDWAVLGVHPTSTDLGDVLRSLAFAPDGMCFDADGAVWVADAHAERVIRIAEGGEILDEISAGQGCYACMLGGDDGRTLFLCLAPDFHADARAAAREASIASTAVDVPHAGTP